jgi:hypothetical protein
MLQKSTKPLIVPADVHFTLRIIAAQRGQKIGALATEILKEFFQRVSKEIK